MRDIVHQFRDIYINPTLRQMGMYSLAASNLLLGTTVQESHLARLKQIGGGPAVGIFQMELGTFHDIHKNYFTHKHDLFEKVDQFRGDMNRIFALQFNFPYATAMARIQYWRKPDPLPDAEDIFGLARYWKKIYNTPGGKGTVEEFLKNYETYILEV